MSIKDLGQKIKSFWENLKNRLEPGETAGKYYTALIIVLVGLSSFGLGRLSIQDENREPITIETDGVNQTGNIPQVSTSANNLNQTASVVSSIATKIEPGGKLVASKNGTKYYFPWCAAAAKIADANKVWFNSEAEARAKGLQPAANCKGLK